MSTKAQLTDRYGLVITTTSAEAAACFNDGIDHLLSSDGEAGPSFEKAVAADALFALAQFLLGRELFTRGDASAARRHMLAAFRASPRASHREREHMLITLLIFMNNDVAAFERAQAHLDVYPRDIVMLDVYAWARFFRTPGGKRAGADYLATMEDHYGDDWGFRQVYAFALADAGDYEKARRLAEDVMEARQGSSATAFHTLAHIDDCTANHREGASSLSRASEIFRGPMREHLDFHSALHSFELGATSQVRRWLEDYLSPSQGRSFNPIDAGSLYHRAAIYGRPDLFSAKPFGARSRAILKLAAGNPPGRVFAGRTIRRLANWCGRSPTRLPAGLLLVALAGMVDPQRHPSGMMLVYGLLAAEMSGDSAVVAALLERLSDRADRLASREHVVTLCVGRALLAFLRGEHDEVVSLLEPLDDDDYEMVGGTRSEQEIVRATLVESYLRSGRHEQALRRLTQGHGSLKLRGRHLWWRLRAELGLGRHDEAAHSLALLERDWCDAEPQSPQREQLNELRRRIDGAEAG